MNRPIVLFPTVLLSALILAVMSPGPVLAQQGDGTVLREWLEETRQRLALTDEQAEAIRPVVADGFSAQRDILARYGIDLENRSREGGRLGLRDARSLSGELEDVRSGMLDRLSGILDAGQLEVYRELQEERRAEMRERLRTAR